MSAEVRNGTIVTLMSVTLVNSSAARFCVLPGLMVPMLSLPGLAFAALITSCSDFSGESGLGHDQQVEERHRRGRGEVLEDVVGQRLEQRHGDGVVVAGHQHGVAVGRGGRDRLGGDDAAGAGPVLDHHLLLEPDRQLVGHDAHADVGDAAGAIGHDELDRAAGIVGLGAGRRGRWRRQREPMQQRRMQSVRSSQVSSLASSVGVGRALFHGIARPSSATACAVAALRSFGAVNRAMRTAHADGTDMILRSTRQFGWLLAAALCAAALPSLAQDTQATDKPVARAAAATIAARSKPTSAPAAPTRTKPRPIGNRSPTSGAGDSPSAATTSRSCSTTTC